MRTRELLSCSLGCMLVVFLAAGRGGKKESQMDLDEIQKMLDRFEAAELEESKKSFSECLTLDQSGKIDGAYCSGNTVTVADIVGLREHKPKGLTLCKCKFDGDVISACGTLSSL